MSEQVIDNGNQMRQRLIYVGALAGTFAIGATAFALAPRDGGSEGPALEAAAQMDETTTTTAETGPGAGLAPDNTEYSFHIAGEGSCSTHDHEDGRRAATGEFNPGIAIEASQVEFLKDNQDFATNMGISSIPRWGFIYDSLNIAQPNAENPQEAAKNVEAVFDNEYYVTAPLAEATTVQNTYCDEQGNIKDYRVVALEAGTDVGGVMINRVMTDSETGQRVVTLANDRDILLPDNALIATVTVMGADGKETTALMLATNKAGKNEVGCMNWLLLPPVAPPVPETTPPEGGPTPTTRPHITPNKDPSKDYIVQYPDSPNVGPEDGEGEPGPEGTTSTTAKPPVQNPNTTTTLAGNGTTTSVPATEWTE